ncbi:Uncharacterized protein DAT39_005533, partial [Clarias magur]
MSCVDKNSRKSLYQQKALTWMREPESLKDCATMLSCSNKPLSDSFLLSLWPFSTKLLLCIAIFATFPLSHSTFFLAFSYTHNHPVGELLSLHRTSLTGDGLPLPP